MIRCVCNDYKFAVMFLLTIGVSASCKTSEAGWASWQSQRSLLVCLIAIMTHDEAGSRCHDEV